MTEKWTQKYWLKLMLVLMLIAGSFSGWVLNVVDYAGMKQLNKSNAVYLDSAFQQSIATFGVLSALKVGLAIVEGTDVGVGINVEVGDAVQAAYDYVDIAWRVVLLGSTVLLGTKYMIHLADMADDWLLFTALFFLLISLILAKLNPQNRIRKIVQEIGSALWTLMIACYLVLPLAVGTGHLMSQHITASEIRDSETRLSEVQRSLFPEEKPANQSKMWQKINEIKNQIQRIGQVITHQGSQLVIWILKLIAGYLFDTLIFPLLLFAVFYWLSRRVLRVVLIN